MAEIRENPEGNNPPTKQQRTLFAFHGFARPLEDLIALTQSWPLSGTLISVHLPHHGQSGPADPSLADAAPIDPATLNQLLVEIAQKEALARYQQRKLAEKWEMRNDLDVSSDSDEDNGSSRDNEQHSSHSEL